MSVNLFFWNSCLTGLYGISKYCELRKNVNLQEWSTPGSLKWNLYSTKHTYFAHTFVVQNSIDWIRSISCSFSSSPHCPFFPFLLLSQKYGLFLLWQLTDGCCRASQMVLSAAHPPSAPHRWFSPPPMFQTRGPSLNPIRTSSHDGVSTSQAISKTEGPHLHHETGC